MFDPTRPPPRVIPRAPAAPEGPAAAPPDIDAPPSRMVAEPAFWLFAGFGLALLAGAVLAPAYREYQAAAAENDRARLEVARLLVRNRQYQELLEAIETDPQFVAGMLRGRLTTPASKRPAAVIADESPEQRLPEPTQDAVITQAAKVPGPSAARITLPERWVAPFTGPAGRTVLPVTAIGCLTIAFVFFAPRRAAPASTAAPASAECNPCRSNGRS
jgi:hypothetical protein